jgi:DnaJ-class molecular chaperone
MGKMIYCWICRGTGACHECRGQGTVMANAEPFDFSKTDCDECDGTGACQRCDGEGEYDEDDDD